MRIPKYRRHASGQARVTIAGVDHYLGVYGTPESRRRYAELIGGLAGGTAPAPSRRRTGATVAELVAAYSEYAERYYSESPAQVDRVRRSLAVVLELCAGERAERFGPAALSRVRDRMIALGWARTHINSCIGCVRRAWKWGVSRELVPLATHQALRTLEDLSEGRTDAPERPPVLPVPVCDLYAALAMARPTLSAMIRFQLLTGCRPGELCRMTPAQIDQAGDVWVYRPYKHKTRHNGLRREILIGPAAQQLIADRIKDPHSAIFRPVDAVAEWHAEMRSRRRSKVQPSQVYRRKSHPKRSPKEIYTPNSYAQAVRRLCVAADVDPWHPNRLRHTCGTWLREQYGPEVARAVLGHTRLDTTHRYTATASAHAIDAVRQAG